MKNKILYIYIPFNYYFNSRYKNIIRFLFFIFKYFGPYILFLLICNYNINVATLTEIFLFMILFYNNYEIMCYTNDKIDIPNEREYSVTYINNIPKNFIRTKIIISLILFIIIYFVFDIRKIEFVIIVNLLLFVIFYMHNHFYHLKLITFSLLYILKGLIFMIPYIDENIFKQTNIVIFILIFNLSYTPHYFYQKYLKTKNIKIPEKFFKAIIFKNIFLIIYFLFNKSIIFLIFYIDILIMFELFYIKYLEKKND